MGRPHIRSETQVRRSAQLARHVRPKPGTISDPCAEGSEREEEVYKGYRHLAGCQTRSKGWHIAGCVGTIVCALRGKVRAACCQFLYIQQGRRTSACSRHIRWLSSTPAQISGHLPTGILFLLARSCVNWYVYALYTPQRN